MAGLAAAAHDSLARTSDGQVLAWGDNSDGQLGNGTTTSSRAPVTVMLPRGTRVTALGAGAVHSLALTSAGKVLAWGSNTFGQLGVGTTTASTVPVFVKLSASLAAVAIAAGSGAVASDAIVRKRTP